MTPNERLERSTWDLFWLPDSAAVIDRPELLVVHSPRPVGYLNTVYRTRAGARDLPRIVTEVRAFHRGVDSRWCVFDTINPAPLERALNMGGYTASHEHDARVVAVCSFVPRDVGGIRVRRVVDEASLRDCWSVNDAAFGKEESRGATQVADELSKCGARDSRILRFVAYVDDEPVSSGGMNLFPELGMGLLWSGGTVPWARGRGAYSAVVAARIAWAAKVGVPFVGLYARVDSSSPIVAAQGFEVVGRMSYWVNRVGALENG